MDAVHALARLRLLGDDGHLEAENGAGPIEHKRSLCHEDNPARIESLTTQLVFRMAEGNGQCVYELGVEDDGELSGVAPAELDASLGVLRAMADSVNAEVTILVRRPTTQGRECCEALVRFRPAAGNALATALRVAVLGSVDQGKSTLCAVLMGATDDGRGLARSTICRHAHELLTGRTSSVGHHVVAYKNQRPVPTNPQVHRMGVPQEIITNADRLVQLIDLCGHRAYVRTTIRGLASSAPDFAMVVIAANQGADTKPMLAEHLKCVLALDVAVFCVVTKLDLAPAHKHHETMTALKRVLKKSGKVPMVCKSDGDVVLACKNVAHKRITPIFSVSSIRGESLRLLHRFLTWAPRRAWLAERSDALEFRVDAIYKVRGLAGVVVSGVVARGVVRVGDEVLLGPAADGAWTSVTAKSLHSNHIPVTELVAGQTGSVAIRVRKDAVRAGMVLLASRIPAPRAVWAFSATLKVLKHHSTLRVGYEAVVHVDNVAAQGKLVCLGADRELLRMGDTATVVIRFKLRPQWVREGANVLLREGASRAFGTVDKITELAK